MEHLFMKRFQSQLILLLIVLQANSLSAQSTAELATAKESLISEVIVLMRTRVFPVMLQWKAEFESRLPSKELNALSALRDRYEMIHEKLNINLAARETAWGKQDFSSFSAMRTLLRKNFNDRLKLYNDIARFTEKNEKPVIYLESRIDSTVEEWRGNSMRLFVNWFSRYRGVIATAMNGPMRDELASLMASCKNIQLEELDPLAKVSFLMWDGEDFSERVRRTGFPVSPLTDCGPKRETILFLESATPNPFDAETSIRFFLPNPGQATVRVVDADGKTLHTLIDGVLPVGKQMVTFKADPVMSAGTYFVLVEAGASRDALPLRYSR